MNVVGRTTKPGVTSRRAKWVVRRIVSSGTPRRIGVGRSNRRRSSRKSHLARRETRRVDVPVRYRFFRAMNVFGRTTKPGVWSRRAKWVVRRIVSSGTPRRIGVGRSNRRRPSRKSHLARRETRRVDLAVRYHFFRAMNVFGRTTKPGVWSRRAKWVARQVFTV
jgi:hypothetical protein